MTTDSSRSPDLSYALLVLTSQLPYPPHQGATIRSYNLIRQLARNAHIDLLSFVNNREELAGAGPLRELCRRLDVEPTPRRSLVQRALTTLFSPQPDMALRVAAPAFHAKLDSYLHGGNYDAILCISIEMGPYLEHAASWRQTLPAGATRPRLIFDDLNAEYLLQQRAFETDRRQLNHPRRWAGAFYSLIQWQKLRRFEARLCRLADDVVAVSEADALALQRIAPGVRVTVVPNGVDLERYQSAPATFDCCASPSLIFTGTMDFRPNVDAVIWFADEVLPLIRREAPEVTFVVVGRDPHPSVCALQDRAGIVVTGAVPDDLPYFRDATVYVVPLRVGGGTRLKVLAAMAMEKGIVSTSLGCEGLGVEHGREVLIADTPADFAVQTLALLKDPARRESLGRAARQFVAARYGWPALAPRLERLYAR